MSDCRNRQGISLWRTQSDLSFDAGAPPSRNLYLWLHERIRHDEVFRPAAIRLSDQFQRLDGPPRPGGHGRRSPHRDPRRLKNCYRFAQPCIDFFHSTFHASQSSSPVIINLTIVYVPPISLSLPIVTVHGAVPTIGGAFLESLLQRRLLLGAAHSLHLARRATAPARETGTYSCGTRASDVFQN